MGVATMFSLPHIVEKVSIAWVAAPIGLGVFIVWQRHSWAKDKPINPVKRWRRHFATIYAFWAGAYGFGLVWLTDLTIPGWVIAALIEALIMSVPTAIVLGACNVARPARYLHLSSALAFGAALALGEAVRWAFPFGGVPLSSLALGAVDAPWAPLARLGGPLLLVTATGLLAFALVALMMSLENLFLGRRPQVLPWAVPLALVAFFSVVGVLAFKTESASELQVAVLQSGGERGERGRADDIFDKHVEITRKYASELADVELLVWSESSVASDGPLEDSPELERLQALASEIDITIIANFYERSVGIDPPRFRNASIAVAPESDSANSQSDTQDDPPASGYLGRYDKVHLVPFGEYIPWREFLDNFADLSLVSRDAIAGSAPGLLQSPVGPLAVASSFEIYFPGSVRSGVNAGGRIVVNPTLASSYRTSWVPAQSLASARLRAIESGRWVLQASTTGYSAVIDPAGNVIGRTTLGDTAVVVAAAELREGHTAATFLSTWPIVLAASFMFAYGLLASKRPARPGPSALGAPKCG